MIFTPQRSRAVPAAGRSSGTRRCLSGYVLAASLPNSESSAAKAVSEITPDAHHACLCSASARLHAGQKKQPDLFISAADISEGSSGEELQMDPASTSPGAPNEYVSGETTRKAFSLSLSL